MKNHEFKILLTKKYREKISVATGDDALTYIRECFDSSTIEWHETSIVICLTPQLEVIGWYKIADGGINTCLFDIKKTMQVILLSNATAFIIAHNHPSGSIKPSRSDYAVMKKIEAAANILELKFIDHFIITKKSYYSLKYKKSL
jgi:DNA repair protein RadC